VEPALLNRVAEATYGQGRVELVPRFQFRDELLRQLTCSLVAEFEQASPPARLYAQSLTHALVAHLLRTHSVVNGKWPSAKGGLPPRTGHPPSPSITTARPPSPRQKKPLRPSKRRVRRLFRRFAQGEPPLNRLGAFSEGSSRSS
jgi:hypothetical protein